MRMLLTTFVFSLGLLNASLANANPFTALNITPMSETHSAPSFELPAPDGRMGKLSDYSGKVVLLNFWATWCSPCLKEMPGMELLWKKYRDQGLVVLGVSNDQKNFGKRVNTFIKRVDLSFPILLDTESEVSDLYDVSGIPVSFLISRDGKILAEVVGVREWSSPEAFALVEDLLLQSQ